MSALFRLSRLRGCQRGLTLVTTNGSTVARRSVSSGASKKDYTTDVKAKTEDVYYPSKLEPWVSYGFCDEDKDVDRFFMHSTMFMAVSVCLVFGSFIICYYPDAKYKDWSTREAYMQLRYREENGLPLIDCNIIDPAKVILPTEEELGDALVII